MWEDTAEGSRTRSNDSNGAAIVPSFFSVVVFRLIDILRNGEDPPCYRCLLSDNGAESVTDFSEESFGVGSNLLEYEATSTGRVCFLTGLCPVSFLTLGRVSSNNKAWIVQMHVADTQ